MSKKKQQERVAEVTQRLEQKQADEEARREELLKTTRPVLDFETIEIGRPDSAGPQRPVHRAKVHGGWLVTNTRQDAMAFVPDPAHEWEPRRMDRKDLDKLKATL